MHVYARARGDAYVTYVATLTYKKAADPDLKFNHGALYVVSIEGTLACCIT